MNRCDSTQLRTMAGSDRTDRRLGRAAPFFLSLNICSMIGAGC